MGAGDIISTDFLKSYQVEKVTMISNNVYDPFFTIYYMDGREIKKDITTDNYDELLCIIRKDIIENNLLIIRKRKIENIMG